MKSFAEAWPDFPMLQQAVAKLVRGHIVILLEKLSDEDTRLPPSKAVGHGTP
ncbi:hypothetical protein [Pseudarthrobacter sp. 1C304]|uniref:hypothetical protein n=1 Tax=Pseudarthrobacter sp. 1C304 TaxID=3457438 RepID=UPI003FD19E2D